MFGWVVEHVLFDVFLRDHFIVFNTYIVSCLINLKNLHARIFPQQALISINCSGFLFQLLGAVLRNAHFWCIVGTQTRKVSIICRNICHGFN